MRDHEEFVDDPPNSYENVLKEVTSKFEPKPGEIPELLFKFITLLGKEDDEWGGVKAMRVCVKEFLSWKSKFQKPNNNVATCKDFESFLFSLDRNVIAIKGGEIHGVVDPSANRETQKERVKDLLIKEEME